MQRIHSWRGVSGSGPGAARAAPLALVAVALRCVPHATWRTACVPGGEVRPCLLRLDSCPLSPFVLGAVMRWLESEHCHGSCVFDTVSAVVRHLQVPGYGSKVLAQFPSFHARLAHKSARVSAGALG